MGALAKPSWADTSKRNLEPRFLSDLPHSHNALDDAREQAEVFAEDQGVGRAPAGRAPDEACSSSAIWPRRRSGSGPTSHCPTRMAEWSEVPSGPLQSPESGVSDIAGARHAIRVGPGMTIEEEILSADPPRRLEYPSCAAAACATTTAS